MYLSKVEIFGFKSFANKTVINLTKDITGVVGPNGCGKTNIVDAVRWCLGEQRSSALRSDKMENVIFNGTKDKKPLGMAEVSMTFVNDKGVLPTEYSEVTITRRIFRSGESEYLLNRNICRLKDITNLFMDTGMGSNAYSVIELKMIETILSSKAEERRQMFEEAAGVNKYKLRRRLSLRKLDDVKSDLVRVNDIVSEVEKNVRSLERQAKKAEKYNRMNSELSGKEIDLAERELAKMTRDKEEYNVEKTAAEEIKIEYSSDIRNLDSGLEEKKNVIYEIEDELKEKRNEISKERDRLHEKQKMVYVTQERIKSFKSNIEKYRNELEELKEQKIETSNDLEENRNEIDEIKQSLEFKSSELDEQRSKLEDARNQFEEKKNQQKEKSGEIFEKFKDISAKENSLSVNKKSLENINQNIEKLNNRIQKLTGDTAKIVGYLEELGNEKSDAENRLQKYESEFLRKQKEKEELISEIGKLKEDEVEKRSLLHNIKDKIEFFQNLISKFEGVSQGSKILLESEGWTSKEKTLFADVGKSEDKYTFALEASLKNVLNNLLIDSYDDLQNAVSFLKKNDLGKASFLLRKENPAQKKSLLDKISEFSLKRKAKKLSAESKFTDWAYNLVQTDDKWEKYFRRALDRSAITETLEDAITLSEKYPEFNFATLEGDIVQYNGIVEGGSLPKLDETLFGRKQLLSELKNEYPQHEEKLYSLKEGITILEEKADRIDLKVISEEGKLIENDINNIEKQINQIEFENKKTSEEIDKSRNEIQELAEESNELDNLISSLQQEVNEKHRMRENAERELSDLENEADKAESDLNLISSDYSQTEINLERLKGNLRKTEGAIFNSEKNISQIEQNIGKRETDINSSERELGILEESLMVFEEEYEEITHIYEKLKNEESVIEQRLKKSKSEAADIEKKLKDIRGERQRVSDRIHQIEMKLNEFDFKLENIKNHIEEEYSRNLELKEFDDLDSFDFKARSEEVHTLKTGIRNLGPINSLAYNEFEEEKDRLDFLLKQRDDLVESQEDLVKTIHDINNTALNLFKETFEQIRENFINIFHTLFDPGDEADLKLEEGADPLEAKIEIIAKPKGKRPTSIELLSGGEKTLTATALLFAIYLVKPSPFCILDEVDAPLDDANVDRFTHLIKEFSANTQFIMVTHNKRTMEAAENMYGVTMQNEGISKLVAVQFNDQLNVTA